MGWVLDQAWRRCVLFHDLCPHLLLPALPSARPALPTDTQTSDAG